MKKEFDKLAERVYQALEELKDGQPTDAIRTLETAKSEVLQVKSAHQLVKQMEFWK